MNKTRVWLRMARKVFSIPYPRFILLDKTQIWLGMARKAFSIPYLRFILLDKTRIWLGMARKAFSIPYPRFIPLDKTRIWLEMARKAFYIPYPRFIFLDKTRIWLGKQVSQEFRYPSVRPPLIRPSVRYPSVRPYPRFILITLFKYIFVFCTINFFMKSNRFQIRQNTNTWICLPYLSSWRRHCSTWVRLYKTLNHLLFTVL